ncbi:leukemia inhibitory factor receptor [Dicentrarchus labrax]|uniref:Fibronectin type-III domain-containing protein n=1 Tax=Dicentrarchus labrax TaxID=13489 RepID=A0A8C4GNM4_DICLA|nr:leukemia inhibitory factor receptor [Dicentrarchus labrax]XP_051269472.1 leukemia inhibitory factor receptor [Dicentrarchus labrax]
MITWLLLFALFCKSTQYGNGQNNGVSHCGPQFLTAESTDHMIWLTWEDDSACPKVDLIYELVVLIMGKQVLNATVEVMRDQIGSTHYWNGTSDLELECASVRLRSRYKNHTSPWIEVQTSPKDALRNIKNNSPAVFPRDRLVEVGRNVTFCCILPVGQKFKKMYLEWNGYNMDPAYSITNQIYALTFHLNQASGDSGIDIKCETDKATDGASVYIGYPPGDKDLQCETRDLESVECHWNVGRKTQLSVRNATVYQLLGSPCLDGSKATCSQKVQVDVGERNWTLTAKNKLGRVELSDSADLTKRVHMHAPVRMKASTVNARNVTLEWEWTVHQYNNLNITCQVNISHSGTNTPWFQMKNFGVGLDFAVLNDLIPDWNYNARVRCGTTQHFWKWSEWTSISFHTKGDVPDALDVWMQVKHNQTIITWKKPLANQSHGHIRDYVVTWAKTTEIPQNRTVPYYKHRLELNLDTTEEYIVTVTARNINGSSSPSTITIPSLNLDKTESVKTINGSNGGFSLSWSASPMASCGYILDWCPTIGDCSVEWLKVPPTETSGSIFSKTFTDGVRYSLSVYACTQGAPVLLERREGYVREKRIPDGLFKSLKTKQWDSDVEIFWDPINLAAQSAFIRGYVLYYDDNNTGLTVSTDDPKATSLRARNLNISSYKFTVKAKTAVGECGSETITVTLNTPTDKLIQLVIISLVTVFGLLSLITIICYRHWACIKHKVYPPIPKPVLLTDKWFTSPGENSFRPLVNDCHHREANNTDVAEVHSNSHTHSAQKMPFVFLQTPTGYYNQPLKNGNPPSLTLPTTTFPSQPGLPSSPFRSTFPNPSYNLIMQNEDHQSNPRPELLEDSGKNSSGYVPQTEAVTVNPQSYMSCDPTYILLPQSHSK